MMSSTKTASMVSMTPIASGLATPLTIEKSPASSSRASINTSTPRFRSRRVKKEDIQQPWLSQKHPREKLAWILPLVGLFVGVAITGVLCYFGLSKVPKNSYCPVLSEEFTSSTLDTTIWTQEVSLGGFGNGDFEETTSTTENAFIQDGALHIKPTLQDSTLLTTNNILNLYPSGCTGTYLDCTATTNLTNGSIINPIKSARLTTLNSHSIRYGRVEVVAQMPKGDWLWPAIWMLPVNSTYGAWPASGEIDIAETRGNNASYAGGYDTMRSTLHWGPYPDQDRYLLTTGTATPLHTTFADGFHTYGLEWSEKYLFTWVDSRLAQVYYGQWTQPFWNKGYFSGTDPDTGDALVDPWGQTGNAGTPFDQDFYLILNVAVGGTNGYFPDSVGGKPWVDKSATAMKEFYDAKDQWYPTWEKSGEMVVKSVKMWQQKGYKSCK